MNLRLHWETAETQGGVILRPRLQHLLWTGSGLDPVSRLGESQAGFTISPPDEDGRVLVEVSGDLLLDAGGRTARRARLRPGSGLVFRVEEEEGGRLALEGEVPADDPLLGRTVGGYRIRQRLGRGAVGTVYRALQEALDRDVALKVLDPELARDPLKVASFKREAVAAGRLSHPNLVQVHDVGEVEGLRFYSMELIPDGSLEDRLREEGPMPWREAVAAVQDCARALSYAEQHHLVHRDVKPANLMVGASGHIKLADLGLAATRGLVAREAAGGTPHFMAPENLGEGPVDHRADLYSLGCTLYRLLTGSTPFQGEGIREILRAHRDDPPPTLRDAGISAPRELEDLLAALLAKDPAERPAHANDVVEACERCLRAPRRRRLAPLLAVMLLAAGVAGWQGLFGGSPAPDGPSRPDPGAQRAEAERARLEARLERERVARLFAEALAVRAPGERLEALAGFLADHPDAEQADEARAAMARARSQLQEQPAEVAPSEDPAASLAREISGLLGAGRPGAALELVDRTALPPELLDQPRREVLAAAAQLLEEHARKHQEALASGDFEAAARERAAAAAALAGPDPLPEPWRAALDRLDGAAEDARRTAATAAFESQRLAFSDALAREVLPALLRLDAAAGERSWQAATAAVEHPGLAAAAAGEVPFLHAAGRAATAVRQRLVAAGPDGIPVIEPVSGKRGQALGVVDEGIEVEIQVRGERIREVVAWSSWLHPETLAGLLRAVLPAATPAAEVDALHLAVGEAVLAERLRAWGAAPPQSPQAATAAAEARAWLEGMPRRLATEPAWLAPHRRAIEGVARIADALAAGEDYLAWQALGDLLSRFSFLAALASDGRNDWGMEP